MFLQIIFTIQVLICTSISPYASAQETAVVACGGRPKPSNGCSRLTDTVPKTDLYGVRCCKNESFPHSQQKHYSNCANVWASSRTPVYKCKTQATFEQAVEHCNNLGARLCTEEELLNKCAKSTGCGLNTELIWSQSITTAPTQAPVDLSVQLTSSPTSSPVTSASTPASLPAPICTQIDKPKTCNDTEGCDWKAGSCSVAASCSISSCSSCNGSGPCTNAGCTWAPGNNCF